MKKIAAAIIIIVLLGGGGYLGWKTWDNKQTKNQPQTNKTQNNNPPKPATSDPTEGGKYLVINEWGIRLPLSAELKGQVKYGIRKNVLLNEHDTDANPIYGDVAYFTSSSLVEAGGSDCDLHTGAHDDLNGTNDASSVEGGPGISLGKSDVRLKDQASSEIKVKNTYFYPTKGNGTICIENSDGSRESNFINSMLQSMKGAGPVN